MRVLRVSSVPSKHIGIKSNILMEIKDIAKLEEESRMTRMILERELKFKMKLN